MSNAIEFQGRNWDEAGDAAKIQNVLSIASQDQRWIAKDARTVRGWDLKYRNMLVRDAGCGWNRACRLMIVLSTALRSEAAL